MDTEISFTSSYSSSISRMISSSPATAPAAAAAHGRQQFFFQDTHELCVSHIRFIHC
jgi:hypothetical protein